MKSNNWYTSNTAGHELHGQSAVANESTGKTVAIVYDGAKHARLIAAAPELLAALQSMDDAFSHYCEGDPSEDEVEALEMARAAIFKATNS
jgi:hypothetical protein